jgi:hypothetical protein
MLKTILIPTDFTLESLYVLKQAIVDHQKERVNIILVHGVHNSDSITDLLFFSKDKFIQQLSNEEFDEAVRLFCTHYESTINSIRKDIFTGFTQAAFNNYLNANSVNEIYYSSNYSMKRSKKWSADISTYILKAKQSLKDIHWDLMQSTKSSTLTLSQFIQVY